MSTSATEQSAPAANHGWPGLPTETEIYILPDGRVIIADLPAELADLAAALGPTEPSALEPMADPAPSR